MLKQNQAKIFKDQNWPNFGGLGELGSSGKKF